MIPSIKLGQIILFKNIIWKYLVFILLFGTQIGSEQASLFVLLKKRIPFLKSNNVKYWWAFWGIFGNFWAIFTCFLHYLTLTNKKTNNCSFWINFFDLYQIMYFLWFVGIRHYSTYYGELFVSMFRFHSFYDSNHLFFIYFDWF